MKVVPRTFSHFVLFLSTLDYFPHFSKSGSSRPKISISKGFLGIILYTQINSSLTETVEPGRSFPSFGVNRFNNMLGGALSSNFAAFWYQNLNPQSRIVFASGVDSTLEICSRYMFPFARLPSSIFLFLGKNMYLFSSFFCYYYYCFLSARFNKWVFLRFLNAGGLLIGRDTL